MFIVQAILSLFFPKINFCRSTDTPDCFENYEVTFFSRKHNDYHHHVIRTQQIK